MLVHRRFLVAAISVAALASVACSEDGSSGAGTNGAGGDGAANGPGGSGGAGAEDATHDAWSLTEAFTVPTEASQVHALAVTDDGYAYVAGLGSANDRVLMRYGPDGQLVDGWPVEAPVPASPSGLGFLIAALADGSAAVAVPGMNEWIVAHHAVDGTQSWTATHALSQNEYGMSLVPTADGGVALVTTVVGAGQEEGCSVVPFGADGSPLSVYTPPNGDGDEAQIIRCVAAGTDAATGDIVLLGQAATTVPWNGGPTPRPALHRVAADFGTATTIRNGYVGNNLTGNFSNGSTSNGHNLAVGADGTIFASEWTAGYAPDTHPTSLLARVGATSHDRWHAAQARMTPFGEAPTAAFAWQQRPAAPITVSVVDTSYEEPFALASAGFEPGIEGMLVDARSAGEAIWVLWQGEDANQVRHTSLTRYEATSSVAEGPAPEPTQPDVTHDLNELTRVAVVGTLSSQTIARIESAPDGGLYVLARSSGNWTIDRLDDSGALVGGAWPYAFSFPIFAPTLDTPATPNIAVLSDGSLIVVHLGQFGWVTKHLLADGSQDWEAEYDSGPEDYPAGIVVDAQGRIVVFGSPGTYVGTPHQDCFAVRYSADGAFDDTFEINVSEESSPAITSCRAGALDATTDDVVLAGYSFIDDPLLGTRLDRGITRLSTSAGVLPAESGEASLFGPVLSTSFVAPQITQGGLVALSDGTLVASLTRTVGGGVPNRLAAVAADSTTVTRTIWEYGARHLTALESDLLVVAQQQSVFHPLNLEVTRLTAEGFEVAASTIVTTSTGWGDAIALSDGPGDTFWLAFNDGNGQTTLARFAVSAK